MGKFKGLTVLLAGTAATLVGYAPAAGQDTPGGLTLTFGISSSIRVNDNFDLDSPSPGTTSLWDNRLSFGLLKESQLQTISFNLEGVVRASNFPGRSAELSFLDDTSADFAYARNLGNSRFEFGADYSNTDLDFLDPLSLIDDLDETDFIIDDGRREILSANLVFETGIDDPFGFLLELDHGKRNYSGTSDPGLFDTDTHGISATGRLRFSPVLEGRLTASYDKYDALDADGTERITSSYNFGITYNVSPTTVIDATLGHQEVEENLTAIPSTSTESGVVGTFALTRELTNGIVGVSLESDITTTGRRSSIELNRALEFPTGSLEASIGATRGAAGDTQAIGSIAYIHELPLGSISASASRSYSTSTLGNDTRTTRAALGYTTQLGRLSGLALDLGFSEVTDVGVGATDSTTTGSFRATYTYELTEDWNLSTGFEHRIRDSDTIAQENSNEVFLTLERLFTIRR